MAETFRESLAAILTLFFILIAPYVQPPWILSVMILVFSLTLFVDFLKNLQRKEEA